MILLIKAYRFWKVVEQEIWLFYKENPVHPENPEHPGIRKRFCGAYAALMHIRPHEKLVVWQRSYELCLHIYALTVLFPKYEVFALSNQMRRSSYSVPMNIAEGNAKRSQKEKLRYFETAQASLEELHVQLRLSFDLHYVERKIFEDTDGMINRVSFLLMKLRKSLEV